MSLRRAASPIALVIAVIAALLVTAPAHAAVRKPSAPRSVKATAGVNSATVRWKRPKSTGGAKIKRYIVKRATKAKGPWKKVASTRPAKRRVVLKGLTGGRAYWIRVFAKNKRGLGAGSKRVKVVPKEKAAPKPPAPSPKAPGAPTGLVATLGFIAGDVDLDWTPGPANGSAITGYDVETSTDGTTWAPADCPNVSVPNAQCSIEQGLSYGTSTDFRVREHNAVGDSPWSNIATLTPLNTPGSPGIPTATPGNLHVELSWTAPTDTGGTPITSYQIWMSANGGQDTMIGEVGGTTTSYDATGLTNGTNYYFTIQAWNAVGPGPRGLGTTATPVGPPGAATISDTQWIDSTLWLGVQGDDGGDDRNIHVGPAQYSLDGGGTWTDLTPDGSGSFILAPVPGQQYTFRVKLENSVGQSPDWSPSVTITASGTPSAPALATPVPGSGSAHLSWQPGDVTASAPAATYYVVGIRRDDCVEGDAVCMTYTHVDAPTTSADLTGLTSGVPYDVQVQACVDGTALQNGQIVATPSCGFGPGSVRAVTPETW